MTESVLDFPHDVGDLMVGRCYRIETLAGEIDFELTELDGGVATLTRLDDHGGYLELDWMEFIDQAALGRIRIIRGERA